MSDKAVDYTGSTVPSEAETAWPPSPGGPIGVEPEPVERQGFVVYGEWQLPDGGWWAQRWRTTPAATTPEQAVDEFLADTASRHDAYAALKRVEVVPVSALVEVQVKAAAPVPKFERA